MKFSFRNPKNCFRTSQSQTQRLLPITLSQNKIMTHFWQVKVFLHKLILGWRFVKGTTSKVEFRKCCYKPLQRFILKTFFQPFMISNCWHFSGKRSISDVWLGSSRQPSPLSGHLHFYHKFAHVVVNKSSHNKFPINNIIHLNHEWNAEAKLQFNSSLRHIFMTSSICFCWKKSLGSLQNNWQRIIFCQISHYKIRAH